MKKKVLLIVFAMLFVGQARADRFQFGDLWYNTTSDSTAEVTWEQNNYYENEDNYSGIKTITIPDTVCYNGSTYTVIRITEGAFVNCKSLKSISIPNSIQYIDNDSFSGCDSLHYNVFDNAKYLGNTNNPYLALFKAKTINITSCEINSNCRFICSFAFNGCDNLKSITIPNSVTNIGSSAFSDCDSLVSVIIGNSVKNISDAVFRGCISLQSITIPNSVTSIGSNAFNACNSLSSVVIGNSVTTIGNYAFYYCYNLTNIEFGNSVTSIGDEAFLCCRFKSITIPNSIESIGRDVFYGCDNLVYNEYSNALYLGNSENPYLVLVKAKSTDITSCEINDQCKLIGCSSFCWDYGSANCNNLTSITIPNSVTSIGYNAFGYCSGLTSVTIPNSVTSIAEFAFYGCSNLTIYCESKSKPEGWDKDWNYDNRPVVWNFYSNENNLGTAVVETATSSDNIYAAGKTIVVENATEEIRVYDAMGKLVCRNANTRVRSTINVKTTGVYIVKIGGTVKRVVVN